MNKTKQKGINTFKKRLRETDLISLEEIGGEFNTNNKYKLIDKDGYLYNLSSMNLSTTIRRGGVFAIFFSYNPYTFENINNYFKVNNIELSLITKNPRNAIEKLEFKCLKHNELFSRSWNSVLNGSINCNQCTGIKKHTLDSIKKIVQEKGCVFLSNYYNTVREDYDFECSCGNKFTRRMDVFMYEDVIKCSKCMGITVNTYKTVKDNLENHNIKLLSDRYKNNSTDLKIKYPCGYITERTLDNIIKSNYQCPHCNKKGYKRNTEQFYKEVYELVGDEYTFEGEYIICDKKMSVTHNLCGYKYQVTPHKFINGGHRCPICSISKQEELISKYFRDNSIDFISEYTFENLIGNRGGLLRFDFAVIKNNLLLFLLEYDGEYHYKPIDGEEKLKIQQEHDNRKNIFCKDNNIKLYRIPYWEQDNLINKLDEILNKELV